MRKFSWKHRFHKATIWTIIALMALPEQLPILVQSANADEPTRSTSIDDLKINVDGILGGVEKVVTEFKGTLPGLLLSQNLEAQSIGWEIAGVAHDLLPADYGPIEHTVAMNSIDVRGVTPQDWNARSSQILASVAGQYDEIIVYAGDKNVQPATEVNIGGLPLQQMSLSYDLPKKDEGPNLRQIAVMSLMTTNSNFLMNAGIFGNLFNRNGGGNANCDSCGPRNYQSCGSGACGGNPYEGNYNQANSRRHPGYRSGNTWHNTGYQGGGQSILGATCCNRATYGIGFKGERNSRFRDVKGIGLRQSFQRYEGPPFGQGRLINFLVNPTCVQRARRRLAIVIATSVATAGGGAVPFLILQNDYENSNEKVRSLCLYHRRILENQLSLAA